MRVCVDWPKEGPTSCPFVDLVTPSSLSLPPKKGRRNKGGGKGGGSGGRETEDVKTQKGKSLSHSAFTD